MTLKNKKPGIYYNPRTAAYGESNMRWVEQASRGLRLTGFADQILKSIRHTGWFTDNFQGELARGVVYQMPARDGREQYAYGVADPCNRDCAFLSFDVTDDKEDAARWADRIAERYAEDSREEDAKYQAERQCEEAADDMHKIRVATLALIREAKGACEDLSALPLVKDTIRAAVKLATHDLERLRKRRAKLADNYWAAVGG